MVMIRTMIRRRTIMHPSAYSKHKATPPGRSTLKKNPPKKHLCRDNHLGHPRTRTRTRTNNRGRDNYLGHPRTRTNNRGRDNYLGHPRTRTNNRGRDNYLGHPRTRTRTLAKNRGRDNHLGHPRATSPSARHGARLHQGGRTGTMISVRRTGQLFRTVCYKSC